MSQMTCSEFAEVVHGLVRMEVLDVALREEALEHASRCGRCSEIMVEARFLADATEATAGAASVLQAPPEIEPVLLRELQSRQRHIAAWRNVQWAAAGALAATLVIVLLVFSVRAKAPTTSGPRKVPQLNGPIEAKGPAPSQPVVQGVDASALGAAPSSGASPAEVADGSSVALNAPASTDDAAAGDFVSVPYTEEIGPDDEAMVVRVQMTRESLAQLGFPVDEVHGSDWVRADVLVGQDGWPRGVRIVQ
jgi:hypothetical protein